MRVQTKEVQQMITVYGLDRLAKEIETRERIAQGINKANRQALNARIKELTDQGIDKELARTMAKCGL